MKPFKPPSFKAPAFTNSTPRPAPAGQPPAKRRRLNDDDDDDNDDASSTVRAAPVDLLRKSLPHKKFVPPPTRQPLQPVTNPSSSSQSGAESNAPTKVYYNVVWRKPTNKKHKTWDGDGVLSVSGSSAVLQDKDTGKELGHGVCKGPLLVGSEMYIGGKEIEVDTMISKEDYLAGRPFLGKIKKTPTLKEINGTDARVTKKAQAAHNKLAATQKDPPAQTVSGTASKRGKAAFKAPMMDKTVQKPKPAAPTPIPRHSIDGENVLIMKKPRSVPKGKQIVDVVIDPLLTKALREHQRAGLSFLYECVMGMKDYTGQGAILADEMGLGKTLQTIALIWTLLKQNPIYGDPPVVKKALIVCPVTLISNWRKEITKWLGRERIGVFVAENPKSRITDFTKGRSYQIMIVGYEKLTKIQSQLKDAEIDLVICDEGHRLKTAANKAAAAIKSLRTDRRVILSGTPIQNDLSEFFTMVDFVNPSAILDKYSTFKRQFEMPILKSRQPGASDDDLEKGEARSKELAEITSQFILRRTSEILSKYLPPKTEHVVFCRPSEPQKQVYRSIIKSPAFLSGMSSMGNVLEFINILKKACNAPQLVLTNGDGQEMKRPDLIAGISRGLIKTPGTSGKLRVLDDLLVQIYSSTEEKVVLVSNYTATMDLLAAFITSLGYSHLRLDGSTPNNKRQELVDRFNRSPKSNSFVFLLSAKAGGVGINLIGASRMILFDCDWNPAVDLQAMARVHRDGQKRECFIYRLLTQGALDEKIFQRQVSKTGLADSIVDGKSAASGFTQQELRDLFTLDESEDCQTHKLLGCDCGGKGQPLRVEESLVRNDLAALSAEVKEEGAELSDDEELESFSKPFAKRDSKLLFEGSATIKKEGSEQSSEHGDDALGSVHQIVSEVDLAAGSSPQSKVSKSRESCRNDLQTLSGGMKSEESDGNIEEYVPLKFNKLGSAADDAALAAMDRKARGSCDSAGNAKFLSLMRYTHFDTSLVTASKKESSPPPDDGLPDQPETDPLDDAIDDEVLRQVIRKPGRRIGFILTKMGHDHDHDHT